MTVADEEFSKKAEKIVQRAQMHGVDIKPGDPFMETLEKLLDRLDAYRDKPNLSGRILIQ